MIVSTFFIKPFLSDSTYINPGSHAQRPSTSELCWQPLAMGPQVCAPRPQSRGTGGQWGHTHHAVAGLGWIVVDVWTSPSGTPVGSCRRAHGIVPMLCTLPCLSAVWPSKKSLVFHCCFRIFLLFLLLLLSLRGQRAGSHSFLSQT